MMMIGGASMLRGIGRKRAHLALKAWIMVFIIVLVVTVPVLAAMNQTQSLSNDVPMNNTTLSGNTTGVFGNVTTVNGTIVNQTSINGTSGDTLSIQSDENVTGTDDNQTSSRETLLAQGTLTRLTPGTLDSNEGEPAVFDDTVVWVGKDEGDSVIVAYQVNTGNQTIIARGLAEGPAPAIYRDRVVWVDYRDENYDIALFNLTTHHITYLTNDTVVQLVPSISGNNVVWESQLDGEDIMYVSDIGTGNVTRVSHASVTQFGPAISGDKIVWEDWRGENPDIYLYNLSTRNETQITFDPSYQSFPAIDGNYIVWVDDRNGGSDIYLYDLITGTESRLTDDSHSHSGPDISGNRIVWVDEENSEYFITLYDISTKQQARITGDVRFNYPQPRINRNRIVWVGSDNGTTDIYMFTLGANVTCPIAGFVTNRTLGEPPLTVQFNDASSGQPDTWTWDFGDGNTSHLRNPVHTYTDTGSYNVILSISTPYCRDAVGKEAFITCGVPPKAGFSANVTSGSDPVVVAFSDGSTGDPTFWNWDFGDNSSSVEQNPVHIFEKAGQYNISLTVRNLFGNDTRVQKNYITVVSATRMQASTNITGMQVISNNATQYIIFDTQSIPNYTFDLLGDDTKLVFTPPSSSGFQKITLYSLNDAGFFRSNNSMIQGNLSKVLLQSLSLIPVGFEEETGKNSSIQYTQELSAYPSDGSIRTIIWEGITPDDYARLSSIPYYSGVLGASYTIQFEKEKIDQTGPVTLLMSVNSTWVELMGQKYGGTLDLISYPAGATVLVDGVITGSTPIEVSLASGNHSLTFIKEGYDNYTTSVSIESARNSIKIIRIAEEGPIEVLNTTFSHSSAEENLDYFEAYSPHGSSKFVLTALARSGNPLQLIYMSVSSHLKAASYYVGGGSSGGGSGGGSGGYTSSGGNGASADLTTETPALTESIAGPPDSVSETVPAVTGQADEVSGEQSRPLTEATEKPPVAEVAEKIVPEVPPGSSIFPVLVNYIIVISAIAILSVGIYLRYKRGE